jgi:2-C-methyl-D-erythritol 2,4-cyclodiphosphate synthase
LEIRAGLGYDIHRLEEGRRLFLGGVEIDFAKGLRGHSDGDCLIHAIIDALLGAAGKDDIGHHFPDKDPRYRDVRSTELLKEVMALMKRSSLEILNVDSIVIAEEPELGPYIAQMKETLAPILGVREDGLGIKAKTNEGMGLIGEGEAIAAWAQVLIREKK